MIISTFKVFHSESLTLLLANRNGFDSCALRTFEKNGTIIVYTYL